MSEMSSTEEIYELFILLEAIQVTY